MSPAYQQIAHQAQQRKLMALAWKSTRRQSRALARQLPQGIMIRVQVLSRVHLRALAQAYPQIARQAQQRNLTGRVWNPILRHLRAIAIRAQVAIAIRAQAAITILVQVQIALVRVLATTQVLALVQLYQRIVLQGQQHNLMELA